jgi:uncharacterized protein (DUF1778 family)
VVVRLNIKLDDDFHRDLKAIAALQGKSLQDFVVEALVVAVRAAGGPPRPRPAH